LDSTPIFLIIINDAILTIFTMLSVFRSSYADLHVVPPSPSPSTPNSPSTAFSSSPVPPRLVHVRAPSSLPAFWGLACRSISHSSVKPFSAFFWISWPLDYEHYHIGIVPFICLNKHCTPSYNVQVLTFVQHLNSLSSWLFDALMSPLRYCWMSLLIAFSAYSHWYPYSVSIFGSLLCALALLGGLVHYVDHKASHRASEITHARINQIQTRNH
jgi:hypothetical protein